MTYRYVKTRFISFETERLGEVKDKEVKGSEGERKGKTRKTAEGRKWRIQFRRGSYRNRPSAMCICIPLSEDHSDVLSSVLH